MWIWSGTNDSIVKHGVVNKTKQFYNDFMAKIEYVDDQQVEHMFPTDLERNKLSCETAVAPGICNGGYDGVGAMFKHIIPNQDTNPISRNLDWSDMGKFSTFDQSEFTDDLEFSSLDPQGYLFVGNNCSQTPSKCRVHVSLHGCNQGRFKLGETYAQNTGYLEWAENLIVIFPQVKDNSVNTSACWDFWGYTGENYATHSGVQP